MQTHIKTCVNKYLFFRIKRAFIKQFPINLSIIAISFCFVIALKACCVENISTSWFQQDV